MDDVKVWCEWCGKPIESGAYNRIGNSYFHNGGSELDIVEPDCYSAFQEYDTERVARGSV